MVAEKTDLNPVQRLEHLIRGQVQGVGFRPCVYRIARRLGLTGWVKNNASGVLIAVQGLAAGEFISHLEAELPPLARIKSITTRPVSLKTKETVFEIIATEQGRANTLISPDTAICFDCLKELFDPQSPYYRYPFLNCTHCGPRFSIATKLPYDRSHTSMAGFALCPACKADYSDPDNRRYHAQPTACADCGPQLSLSIEELAQALLNGKIIALKGLSGYQLLCDARNEHSLNMLRERKARARKPFALMAANCHSAESIVELSTEARELLESRARPIVLLRKKEGVLPESIAPDLNHFGLMLPSTPLHYLLFNFFAGQPNGGNWLAQYQPMILVVTSANPGGEPLLIDDVLAEQKLQFIADKVVSYNRQIITRADDSVLRLINGVPLFIRRARGYVPEPIELAHEIPPTLALGAHLKNTFCITRGNEAFVSQHIGSLNNKASIDFFHESLAHLLDFLAVKPERIAHDLHPDFYTTRLAEEYDLPVYGIQHHHAHLASVVAEQGIETPILGLALDGYGYGLDGQAWGGELLLLDGENFTRLGSLYPFLQPGGEIVAREPWRMAASVMHRLGRGAEISQRFPQIEQALSIQQLLDKKINSPSTSSCGRLFDAASALLGIQVYSQYEGQAAMRLESLVTGLDVESGGWQMKNNNLDFSPLMALLFDESEPILGANLFHGTLIAGLCAWVQEGCRQRGLCSVVLSGGCFLNQVLAEGLTAALKESGIKAYLPRALPPSDGGLSLGQAWIAGIQ